MNKKMVDAHSNPSIEELDDRCTDRQKRRAGLESLNVTMERSLRLTVDFSYNHGECKKVTYGRTL